MNISFKEARAIALEERDAELDLGADAWPVSGFDLASWNPNPDRGILERAIHNDEGRDELATPLRERVLRFPSAPIHGLHRLGQDQVNMGPVESFHTLRLLSHPKPKKKTVSRIFLMHNGLNELRKVGLYYEIASHLIEQDPNTVCLVRPFPGHLTRCPYPGLSETPLDHYLWDGLHLFRQFLRYMIETRWLLSTIVRYSTYRCVSGSGLLVEKDAAKGSRLDTSRLTEAMMGEWENLYGVSALAIEDRREGYPEMCDPPDEVAFEQAIKSLRGALSLRRRYDGDNFDAKAEPELHTIGYSLGGFTAQSVFMSWPFLVSSCSTLLSGGAMRELAPTAFADPEEWQTVLHSLRYELDDALMDWRFQKIEDKRPKEPVRSESEEENPVDQPGEEPVEKPEVRGWAAGINPYLFLFLKRTFYEVFEQEYRGSFQTRLVDFRQRMLSVVGGNDPIVRPQNVLDSGPPDGINLLSIGGLGHFLADTPQLTVEKEQRKFWVPEIAGTIGKLANAAARKHRLDLAKTWLDKNELVPQPGRREINRRKKEMRKKGRLTVPERLDVEEDGALSSPLFQRSLDDLLARATDTKTEGDPGTEADYGKGLLFILRNEPPTFLLGEKALQQHASALYHEDVSIVNYVENVRTRRALAEDPKTRDRICMILPWNVETIIRRIDAGLQHPSQSESSGEQMEGPRNADGLWHDLRQQCEHWTGGDFGDTVRVFHAPNGVERLESLPKTFDSLATVARTWLDLDKSSPIKPSLPDCWIWMSNGFLERSEKSRPSIEYSREELCTVLPKYVHSGKDRKRWEKQAMIAASLQKDDLRMVTVSRSRYNPRFRGRIIAEPRQAQELLLRAALCIVASSPYRDFEFEKFSPQVEEPVAAAHAG